MPDFFLNTFNASLATEAILFAAFGFLLAAYTQYSTLPPPPPPPPPLGQQPPADLERASIANTLARVCQIMVGLIALNAIIALYSLVRMGLPSLEQILLAAGFAVTMIALAVISAVLARRM